MICSLHLAKGGLVMLPREIQTRRLWLRPVEVPDAEPLSPILNEISVGRNMTQTPHPCDPEIARSFTVQSAGKPGHWTVEDAGGVIGWCKHDRVLSYLLAPSAWGQGYASELSRAVIASVFQVEAPNQIRAGHRIDNGASARVLAKQGMRGDGYLQRTVMATGERAVASLHICRIPSRSLPRIIVSVHGASLVGRALPLGSA